ncbi:DNA methyltransferase [Mesorhizobium sp. LSJC268A00]|uniref:DNA cytosine methyltransferase n=1 Tax=unclassified Mesorhizobium TaxID=325217 RepID=UPI0003CF8AB9|nr:DNA (cytosine-5-)-methyltransferase [Mesorhizobium sp. LSJC268A00]ESW95646.1 DNA methyltransferase [Mesorhizobium sp. LSJC268A00]
MMKVAGLFAGIGGLEIGLAQSGHQTVLLSEILPGARAVLSARLPGVDLQGDVCKISSLPADVEIVAAGFPCQDLSQAGLARGLDGDRSGLVGEVFRLAKDAAPRWIVLENVPFMLQLRRGDAMRRIVDELEALGYRWAWRVVDTFGFGLPQRRERVILVASKTEDPANVLFADAAPLSRPATAIGQIAHGFYWTEGRGGLGWAADAIPTLKNGSAVGIPSPPAILLPEGRIIKPDIRDAERLQGFPSDWTVPAETVGRTSARWGLIGSAVSVPVAKWLGSRLAQPGHHETERDRSFAAQARLPRAARFDGRDRHAVDIGPDPLGLRPPNLVDFLRHDGALLSPRATAGFLGRTYVAKLRFAPGFIDAVQAHLRFVEGIQIEEKRVA